MGKLNDLLKKDDEDTLTDRECQKLLDEAEAIEADLKKMKEEVEDATAKLDALD